MENKKGVNFFWGIIAIILGCTLFKHFDFKNLTFKHLALDVVYLIIFSVSIYFLVRKSKN